MILFDYYFWIVVLDTLIAFLFGKHYLFSVIVPLSYFILSLFLPKRKSFFFADIFVLLILVSTIMSWLFNEYAFKKELIFRHIMGPMSYMACYFIGRNYKREGLYTFLEKALLPAAITSLIGIYCFFFSPSWYMSILYASSESGELSHEALRLHSIFSSPYLLSYMNAILLIHIIFRIVKHGVPIKKYLIYILIFTVTLIFCMMRAPMAAVLIGLSVSIMYMVLIRKKISMLFYTVFGIGIASLIIIFSLSLSNAETIDFFIEKFEILTDKNDNFIENRYKLYESEFSLFGDGAGRHNIFADDYVPKSSIKDGEYQKIQQEIGFVGMLFYAILLIFILLKSLYYFRYLTFELCIICFLLISMIGANPLSTPDKHCFIFWLIMGLVASFGKCDIKMEKLKKEVCINNR